MSDKQFETWWKGAKRSAANPDACYYWARLGWRACDARLSAAVQRSRCVLDSSEWHTSENTATKPTPAGEIDDDFTPWWLAHCASLKFGSHRDIAEAGWQARDYRIAELEGEIAEVKSAIFNVTPGGQTLDVVDSWDAQLELCIARWEAEVATLRDERDLLAREMADLRKIIAARPKCWRLNEHGEPVQDVPVVPGMVLWIWSPTIRNYDVSVIKDAGWLILSRRVGFLVKPDNECANSREAAEALKKRRDADVEPTRPVAAEKMGSSLPMDWNGKRLWVGRRGWTRIGDDWEQVTVKEVTPVCLVVELDGRKFCRHPADIFSRRPDRC